MEDQIERQWRKATFSGNGGGDCVEVANSARVVMVRDSKRAGQRNRVMLAVPASAWREFTSEIKRTM